MVMSLWKGLVVELDGRQPLPPLHPSKTYDPTMSADILHAAPEQLVGEAHPSALCVASTRAGLLLWNDDLDAAHTIVQAVHETIGSYWHAILHRREGDYDNAKYWFARVGQHPIFDSLYNQAVHLWPVCASWKTWSPAMFVDIVAEAVSAGEHTDPTADALRKIQVVEMSHLLRYGLSN